MALASNALTTVEAVRDDLGLPDATQNARIERSINAASAAIERLLRRSLARGSRTAKLEGSGDLRLVVPERPLVSVTSIVDEDGTTVDSDTYAIENAGAGIIIGDASWLALDIAVGTSQDPVSGTGKKAFTVTYVSGYYLPAHASRDLPYDIEEACIMTAASLFRKRGSDQTIASEAVGDASVSYGGVNTAIGRGLGGIVPDAAVQMLRPYMRVL